MNDSQILSTFADLPLPGAAASVHCQPSPGATLAFVFICPGRHEANRGYPCAAGTGANLARALVVLEQVLGVMYVAFLIARLANMYGRERRQS